MTKIVVDTNIVFSALLNINSRIAQVIISGGEFYAPEYLRIEIMEHKSRIQKMVKLSDLEFLELYETIMHNITVINGTLIPKQTFQYAKSLCESIDLDDTEFVATVEFIEGKLWTGDLKLINGLYRKGYQKGITTDLLFEDYLANLK